jgi:arabinogalactan endo-1,4-beta-galactosidase
MAFRWPKNNGAKYDVIGMSLYPSVSDWTTKNSQCLANINDMVARYGKEVIICEVGMNYTEAQTAKDMLSDLINKIASVSGGRPGSILLGAGML